ncbi:DUF5053 domain-containing protein [Bacteroides fragilis]
MDVKKEFIRLKEQWMNSKGEAREKADVEMQAFFDSLTEKDKKLIAEAVDEDFSKIHQKIEDCKNLSHRIEVRKRLEEVLPFISISKFAEVYFGKSASWLHQRINGNVVHGKPCRFTDEEIDIFNKALQDISKKIGSLTISY